jgi:hypothetical protein
MSDKYKISNINLSTIKPSKFHGNYMNFDIGIHTEDENNLFNVNIQISRSLLKTLNLDKQILQNILKKKVIEYLKDNNYEVDSLELKTKIICSQHLNSEGCFSISSRNELKNIKLVDIKI